jgi:TRAP-type C4-dicarboxylate transport system permease small subunit
MKRKTSVSASASSSKLRPMPKWLSFYLTTVKFLAITGIAALALIAALQVFYRYVLDDSLFWSEELMRSLMVWVAFLTAGVTYSRGEMLGMHFVLDIVPAAVRHWLELAGRLLTVLFLLVVAWYGLDFMLRTSEQESVALEISVAWIHASIPVGCLLLAAHVLFTGRFQSALPPDEAPHIL